MHHKFLHPKKPDPNLKRYKNLWTHPLFTYNTGFPGVRYSLNKYFSPSVTCSITTGRMYHFLFKSDFMVVGCGQGVGMRV